MPKKSMARSSLFHVDWNCVKQHDTGYKIKKEYQTVRERIMVATT